MAEFVVELTEKQIADLRRVRRERIVRCRDCKYSTSMGYQCKWFHGSYLTHAQVVPEGFCAWGEEREQSE